jgi:hypothetical protein
MFRSSLRTAWTLSALWLLALPLVGNGQTPAARERGKPAVSAGAAEGARDVLAKFDKGDPGWQVRMTALVNLVRAGPDAVPVLREALQHGPPSTREFAAQVLVFIADPRARPALDQALRDEARQVRIYASNALSMFGRLEPTEPYRRLREQDNWAVRRHMAFALERDDKPDPAALRRALAGYDLAKMDSARLGQAAPDFSLTDLLGQTYQLGQFRGKRPVVLLFLTIA